MLEAFSAAGAQKREAPLSSRRLKGVLEKKESEPGACHDQVCISERTFVLKVVNRLDVGKEPCRRRYDETCT